MNIKHALLAHDFPEVRTFWIGRTDDNLDMEYLKKIIDANAIVLPEQKHTKNVAEVTLDNFDKSFDNTDALVTKMTNVAIAIKTADCVPIIIFDPVNKIIAAAHAGWRGTVTRIVEQVIKHMEHLGSQTHNLYAHIGAAISQSNYEVGDDVIAQFEQAGFEPHTFGVYNDKSKKFYIDLREANHRMLLNAGIPDAQITMSETCTFNSPLCYSARRDGIDTGRNITGIMLR